MYMHKPMSNYLNGHRQLFPEYLLDGEDRSFG